MIYIQNYSTKQNSKLNFTVHISDTLFLNYIVFCQVIHQLTFCCIVLYSIIFEAMINQCAYVSATLTIFITK